MEYNEDENFAWFCFKCIFYFSFGAAFFFFALMLLALVNEDKAVEEANKFLNDLKNIFYEEDQDTTNECKK